MAKDNHDEMMRLAFKEDVKITIAIVPKNSAVVLQEPYNKDNVRLYYTKEDVKITIAIVPKNSAVVLQEPYNKDNVRLYYTRPESDNEFNRRTKYHGRPEGWRE